MLGLVFCGISVQLVLSLLVFSLIKRAIASSCFDCGLCFKNLCIVLWLGILNLPLALYSAKSYAPNIDTSPWFVSATYGAASFGHYFLYFALVSLLLIFPVFAFKQHIGKWRFIYATVIITLCHIVLATDAKVFELYRFHISYAMIDLFFNAGGEVIELSTDTWISIVFQIAFCAFYSAIMLTLAMFCAYRGIKARIFVILALICYLIANLIHAYSSAKQVFPIVELQNRIPVYYPLTMNSKLVRWGIVNQAKTKKQELKLQLKEFLIIPKSLCITLIMLVSLLMFCC